MNEKTLNQITRSVREIESSLCDLIAVLDKLNCYNESDE